MSVHSLTGEVEALFIALQPDEIDSWIKLVHIYIHDWSFVYRRIHVVNSIFYFIQLEDELLSDAYV